MQDDTKDFLKDTFWRRKTPLESLTSWWDWSKENPFLLIRQEVNDYVWHEYTILNYLYGQYKVLGQRLSYDKIDEMDIEMTHGEKITVYFDLTQVF
jgi:hypothetical protein